MYKVLLVGLIVLASWIGNAVKLFSCDFEPNYKCELIHTVGLVPVFSVLTVWVDSDE